MSIPASYVGSLTAHAMFVPEGTAFTVPSAGTVGRDSKPGAGDTVWGTYNLGDLRDFKRATTAQTEDIWGGAPGGRVKKDVVEISKETKITFSTQQRDPISARFEMASLALTTASTQANPLEGVAVVKGWLKIQFYDKNSTLVEVVDVWVALRVVDSQPSSGANLYGLSFEGDVLFSQYNTRSFPA